MWKKTISVVSLGKYSWRGLIWMVAHVFHQYHHFWGSQWSYGFFWFLNLKWFPTSYWHHDSLVSCFCGSCSPQRLVHVLAVEELKTQENYMYKNQDNRKSHEKYQPWESGKPGITESHRAKETKRTWEPQVPETWGSKRRTRMLVKVNMHANYHHLSLLNLVEVIQTTGI